ncbi:MAG: hypothetical protein ACLQBA_14265 [Candidatus Binataceae bacterium]
MAVLQPAPAPQSASALQLQFSPLLVGAEVAVGQVSVPAVPPHAQAPPLGLLRQLEVLLTTQMARKAPPPPDTHTGWVVSLLTLS